MTKSARRLSPLEWEVMNIVWKENREISVREVVTIAYPDGEKAYTTVQTVMTHLEEKGFLKKTKIGLVNFYKSVREREEIMKSETSGFVNRVYNGSFKALANYIVDSDSLTPDEIEDLRELIKRRSEKITGK